MVFLDNILARQVASHFLSPAGYGNLILFCFILFFIYINLGFQSYKVFHINDSNRIGNIKFREAKSFSAMSATIS